MTGTMQQRHRARALLRECDRLQNEVAGLKQLITNADIIRRAHDTARFERLLFNLDPNRLAGLVELLRTTDPETARLAPIRYHHLLQTLHPATTLGKVIQHIDYAVLRPEARPYLLGPFLNLSFGNAFPRLCLQGSNPASGRLVYISPNGPSEEGAWRTHLPAIRDWLGGDWELIRHTVSVAELERRTPLPAAFPFDSRSLAPGHLYAGVDVKTRHHVHMPFADLPSGTLLAGATGTGKSNALHILLQSIFANLRFFSSVYLVDGKDGVTLQRYARIAPGKVHVLWEERHLWTLTTHLVEFMRARNADQRARNIDNATGNFVALIIDEMSTFTAKPSGDAKHPDNKLHARFLDELAMVARRGRSTGIRLFVTAQEPVAEQIPPTIRANCLNTISLKLPIDAHATALFGQLEGLPADPRHLQRGRALLKNGITGEIRHVQFPVMGMPR